MSTSPQVTEESIAFQTPWLTVRQARVSGPEGDSADWFYLDHPGCALVVPVTSDGRVLLVHIWRVAVGRWCWEAPAGRIDPGEDPAVAALRELHEETGATATDIRSLGTAYSSTGSSNEKVHLFLATGVRLGEPLLNKDEVLRPELFSVPQALSAAATGGIEDGATCLALLRAHHLGHLTPEQGML